MAPINHLETKDMPIRSICRLRELVEELAMVRQFAGAQAITMESKCRERNTQQARRALGTKRMELHFRTSTVGQNDH